MNKDTGRAELAAMLRTAIAYGKAGTIPQVPEIKKYPASNYFDPDRFQLEVKRVFKRLPLMLATTAEMPKPGDYKTIEAVGVPVLIVRQPDGTIRAFINSCLHRGANVATAEYGNSRLITCPYHGWAYSPKGDLVAVAAAQDFGAVDKSCLKLKTLPSAERAGLIWVIIDPKSTLDIDAYLCGYDAMLAQFGFTDWHFFSKRILPGPNWKIAYDGYLDYYHLPVLHRNTFGEQMSNQAIYNAWGPHQRLQFPVREFAELEAQGESEWSSDVMLKGVWTIFPHISIASFDGGGRGVMISQLLPGDSVGESFTTQYYLMETAPDEERAKGAHEQFAFLGNVVRDEDYFTGLRQQRALKGGGVDEVMFGRNEGGAQNFHAWLDRIVAASDEDLPGLFAEA